MVLERLFPASWVEKRLFFSFLLGLCYSIIGIGLSMLIFPQDPALAAVAFTSILLLPEINEFFRLEREQEEKLKEINFGSTWGASRNFIKSYLFIMLGVFVVYSIAAILLDNMAVSIIFREQLKIRGVESFVGAATNYLPLLSGILLNNLVVLFACFALAFLTGDGAIILLVWNASVWGTIFGITARTAASVSQKDPFIYLLLILIIVLPHALTEMLSYILAGISGGSFSEVIVRKPKSKKLMQKIIRVSIILAISAIVVLWLSVLVETLVLEYSELYGNIILQSLK